jgi:hypothetical protein
MDILSISQLAGLGSDQWSSGSTAQRKERAAGGAGGDAKEKDQDQSKVLKPEELYDTARLRSDMLYGYHGLNLREAQTVLAGLAPQIADLSPFRAADLQKVTASKLIPSAYV